MWYVMQVRTGTEENIRCQCQRLISSNVLERCFIPYYQQKKRFQGEWHIQERILFPGYVFFNCRKSGKTGKWTQESHRTDEADRNRR